MIKVKRFGQRVLLAAVLSTLFLLSGCIATDHEPITSLSQLGEAGRRIGVPGDIPEYHTLQQDYPEAEVLVYDSYPLAYADVATGRLDAYVYARREMELAIENGAAGVRLLDESYSKNTVAVGLSPISPIPELSEKINAFISELKSDGTLDDMYLRWVVQSAYTMPTIDLPEHPAYHLRVGTTGTVMPYSYYAGTQLCGYDIELAYRFAAWLGADIEFKVYDFGGTITAAVAGDIDCIMSNLYLTPENIEAIPFSDPLFEIEITAMVRDEDAERPAPAETVYRSLADFGGKRVGVVTGAIQGPAIEKEIPTAELSYFNSVPDLLTAAKLDKIDAFAATKLIIRYLMLENDELTYLDEALTSPTDIGAIFPKTEAGAALRSEFNTYLAEAKAAGVLEELDEIWLGKEDARKTVLDISSLSGENGTLVLATDGSMIPHAYVKNNVHVGMDIDLVLRFCAARGYALEIMDIGFSGLVDAVVTGKCDFAVGAIGYTKERAESVDYSDPIFQGYSVIAYLKSGSGQVNGSGTRKTLAELTNAKIGVGTGSNFSNIILQYLPDAELCYFNTLSDEIISLKSGKIDGFVLDEPAARSALAADGELAIFPKSLGSFDFAFILTKSERGNALCDELSDYLDALRDDGILERLQSKWFDCADPAVLESTDYRGLRAEKGTIRLATEQYPPFCLCVDGLYSGYEIELLAMFCRERGYALEIQEMNVDTLLAAVQSGRCDIGSDCLSITDERKESLLFTTPDYSGGTALVVLKDTPAQESDTSFLASVRDSFEKTFLRENRWKLFIAGVGTTLLITVLSIIFGTVLGFGVYLLCRNGNPVANAVTRFFVWLVHGMPMVVLLMILYYIVFGRVAVSGTVAAIIGFTLVFGASMFGMLKSGVGAVEKGQLEAAYALGYTDRRAFFRIILPQALPHFFPAYKGEITATIKATAIVGYVAVQDLTKMGDIVRSRTYEAFFPLIAVAIIYFILAGILTAIVNRLGLFIDPRRKKKEDVLKGVAVK